MKPIHFPPPIADEMIRAILDGRKSVTRRVVKLQPTIYGVLETLRNWSKVNLPNCPGDILYVRETWALQFGLYWHKAGLAVDENGCDMHGTLVPTKWRSSIHMPKEAARLFLRVTDVRAERLQDITDDGILAEGIRSKKPEWVKIDFADLWNATIKKADLQLYGWDANPFVWVVSFKRISKEEAYCE